MGWKVSSAKIRYKAWYVDCCHVPSPLRRRGGKRGGKRGDAPKPKPSSEVTELTDWRVRPAAGCGVPAPAAAGACNVGGGRPPRRPPLSAASRCLAAANSSGAAPGSSASSTAPPPLLLQGVRQAGGHVLEDHPPARRHTCRGTPRRPPPRPRLRGRGTVRLEQSPVDVTVLARVVLPFTHLCTTPTPVRVVEVTAVGSSTHNGRKDGGGAAA